MSTIGFLIGLALFIGVVVAVIERRSRKAAVISEMMLTDEFRSGYDAALDAYRRTLSVRKMIESHKIDREKGDCTPYEYGYACALADIADEPRPAPWGKSNA
jgi:hypothetical protein